MDNGVSPYSRAIAPLVSTLSSHFVSSQTHLLVEWAVEGFTEAVAGEVKPEWGIKFTLIEPGGFRTVSLHLLFGPLLSADSFLELGRPQP